MGARSDYVTLTTKRIYTSFKRSGSTLLTRAGTRADRRHPRTTKERIVAATKSKGLTDSKRAKLEKKRSKLEKKLSEVVALLNPPPAEANDEAPAPKGKVAKGKKAKKAAKPAKTKAKAKSKSKAQSKKR